MDITIEIKYPNDEIEEHYGFTLFDDLKAVFTSYHKYVKPKGKRKWTTEKFWDKYSERDSTMAEPELPSFVRDKALDKIKEICIVQTWKEYKNIK